MWSAKARDLGAARSSAAAREIEPMSGKYAEECRKPAVEDLGTIGLSPVVCFPAARLRR
jgi:hypothetical protein